MRSPGKNIAGSADWCAAMAGPSFGRSKKNRPGTAMLAPVRALSPSTVPVHWSQPRLEVPPAVAPAGRERTPSKAGFAHYTDKATGVPDWWQPFSETWTFHFPSKEATH